MKKISLVVIALLTIGVGLVLGQTSGSVINLKIEMPADENVRLYHLDKSVADVNQYFYSASEVDFEKAKNKTYLALARQLFKVEGVARIYFVDRYQITVQKGAAFDWKVVESKVLEVIKQHYKASEIIIIKNKPKSKGAAV